MQPPAFNQYVISTPDADLGAQRYEYRYPLTSRLIAIGLLLLAPLGAAGFILLALRPASLNDQLIPAFMALVLIGGSLYLAYRQASFAWTVITIYEYGLRFDFWTKHLVIPWTQLGKLYLGPGRMPTWHITDRDDHILCELRASAVGRAFSADGREPAPGTNTPSIIDALVEEGGLIEREHPFRHYTPGPQSRRKERTGTA